jgi:hypothetical protein
METKSTTLYHERPEVRIAEHRYYDQMSAVQNSRDNPLYKKLVDEGCECFYTYIDWLGLANITNLIALSSYHHYYYDTEDLREVQTVVNLKLLNYVKKLKDLLFSVSSILPKTSYFIGSFIDSKSQYGYIPNLDSTKSKFPGKIDPIENGIESKIPFLNLLYNIMDLKTNRNMTIKTVRILFEEAELKVLDMTEFNGLTYFCTQKI